MYGIIELTKENVFNSLKRRGSMSKLYAIKYTPKTNEYNKIVDTWEICKALTHGHDALYKSFNTIEECNKYFKSIDDKNVHHIIKLRNHNSKFRDYTISVKRDDIAKLEAYASRYNIEVGEMLTRCIYKQLINKI